MRILITRTDRIGDVMLSTPVIKALRDKYPDAHIAFCVKPEAVEIVDKNPYLNEVVVYDKRKKYRRIFGIIRFIFKLRRKKFDLAIILHPTNRMNISCFLAGIPRRVGYNKKLGFLLTDKIPHTKEKGEKHELEYALDVIRYIGVEGRDKRLYMSLHSDTETKVKHVLEENNIHRLSNLVVIAPGASCPSKRWPSEYFAELIEGIHKKYGAKIIIVGDKFDTPTAKNITDIIDAKVVNLTGKTSLSVLAGILSKARVFISNDSGPVHIAVSVATPVVVMFGRSDAGLSPKRWGPLGDRDIVLHKDVGCGKCLAHNCQRGFACLKAIPISEVLDAASSFL